MYCNTYKKSVELRNTIDNHLLSILNDSNAVQSFHIFLYGILKDISIRLEQATKPFLSLYSDKDGDERVVFLFFYIRKLISLNYIQLIQTPAIQKTIELGESTVCLSGYLPENISDFISSNDTSNIVVSPEFKEFVKAGHISLELYEARKSANASIIAAICAFVSTIIALLSLFINLFNC